MSHGQATAWADHMPMASHKQSHTYGVAHKHAMLIVQVEVRGVVLPAHAQLCVLSYEHDWCLHDINVTERADRTTFDPPPSFALVRKTSTDFCAVCEASRSLIHAVVCLRVPTWARRVLRS